MSDETKAIIERHNAMKARRATLDSHLQEIAERVLPRQDQFFGASRQEGEKRTAKQFDSTAALALERFAAILENLLTPRNSEWHKIGASNPDLMRVKAVREWYADVNRILFQRRYAPRANFASQRHETNMALGAFGTGAMFIDGAPGSPLLYRALHISEICIAEDAWGVIDTVHREYKMTARQAVQKWGAEVGESVHRKAAAHPEHELMFLHAVFPNEDRKPGARDASGMRFASRYICLEDGSAVERGGYRTFPYSVSRYVKPAGGLYGSSPAMTALPDIKTLNEAGKTRIRRWHHALDPSWLIHDDGVMAAFQSKPGALIPGGVDDEGRRLVHPLQDVSRWDVDQVMTDQLRAAINDVFLVKLFETMVETPNMTATEVLERARERAWMTAPVMGRQQSEALGPQIEREFDLLHAARVLPPMPGELMEAQDGGDYDVEYISPMAAAAKAEQALIVLRTVEGVAMIAQMTGDPSALDRIDVDKSVARVAEAYSFPEDCLASDDLVAAKREQRAQQQAVAAMTEAAPMLAGAAKDMSAAGAMQGAAAA